MQETPKRNNLHIDVFGRRNAGKLSLINSLTNQELDLVSAVPGTTTDPEHGIEDYEKDLLDKLSGDTD